MEVLKDQKLLKEWDYEKNKVKPDEVDINSDLKIYWKCPNNHSYRRTILERIHGGSCPRCNGGRRTSYAEQALFFYLKKLHQDAINKYTGFFDNQMEVDIYLPKYHFAIEYDGLYWHQTPYQLENERRKYEILKSKNIHLVRIKEKKNDGDNHCDYVIETGVNIRPKELQNMLQIIVNLFDPLVYKGIKRKSEVVVDLTKDEISIINYLQVKKDSLGSLYPKLSQEWCYEKNGNLTPFQVKPWSEFKVFWKCKYGHIWQARVDKRVEGTGCPICHLIDVRENNPRSKMVYQYDREGNFIRMWKTSRIAGLNLKINSGNILNCANHKRKTAGGYRWEFSKVDLNPLK